MNDSSALLNTYQRHPIELVRGNGVFLYDEANNEYLDFLSGIAVNGFGHQHPDIVRAVQEQVNKLWHVSNLYISSGQELLARKLSDLTGLSKTFFCNSGTEANEAAIKFARKYGNGKFHIITAVGSFHGRTMGSLSATGQPKLWQGFFPLVYGFTSVEYNNLKAIESAITSETIAVLLEPIQGENGIVVPDANYLTRVRQLCDKYGLLLILDEVQTGIGRTGKSFAYQWANIQPDIITLAKGLANGFPLGAVVCSDVVASQIFPGDHGSTFGGNPVAVAAANEVLNLLTDEILSNNLTLSEYLKSKLTEIDTDVICNIRGQGLMIGVQLKNGISAKQIAKQLLDKNIMVGTSGDSVIRILPPFIIEKEHIDLFVHSLSNILSAVSLEEVAA